MPPIVVCTLGSRSLAVLEASVQAYVSEGWLHVFEGEESTFGEAYNFALETVFRGCDELILCNDDVVLTPDSYRLLLEDVAALKDRHGARLGVVAAMADNARDIQNVRRTDAVHCREAERVSPIFAWMSKAAFETARFPPLNWYSDDVLCEDLREKGFRHYISRSYVHHAGSQTVGTDYAKLNAEAMPWLREHRPLYLTRWFA